MGRKSLLLEEKVDFAKQKTDVVAFYIKKLPDRSGSFPIQKQPFSSWSIRTRASAIFSPSPGAKMPTSAS